MTALFLACAVLLAFTSGIGEKNFMDQFIGGAADLMSVALLSVLPVVSMSFWKMV